MDDQSDSLLGSAFLTSSISIVLCKDDITLFEDISSTPKPNKGQYIATLIFKVFSSWLKLKQVVLVISVTSFDDPLGLFFNASHL